MSKWIWSSQGYFPKIRTLLLGKIQSCNLNEIETTLLQISLKEIFPQTIFFNGNRLKMFMHFHLRLLLWNSLKLCQYHENRVLSSTWLKAVFLSYLDWFLIQEGLKWPNICWKGDLMSIRRMNWVKIHFTWQLQVITQVSLNNTYFVCLDAWCGSSKFVSTIRWQMYGCLA